MAKRDIVNLYDLINNNDLEWEVRNLLFKRAVVDRALSETLGNRTKAAKLLNISRYTLQKTISKSNDIMRGSKTDSKPLIKETRERVAVRSKKPKRLDSVRLISYFQQGLKLKEIAELMECKSYKVRNDLIDLLGEKKYNKLKDVYRFCKRENMEIPEEYLIQ